MNFHWHLSFQDEKEYKVYGSPRGLRTIEVYRRPLDCTVEYMRKYYNGDDEEFTASVLARHGGCAVRYRESGRHEAMWNRWYQDEYEAFVMWLRERHEEDERTTAEYRKNHPDIDFGSPKVFRAPVPIYWDQDEHTWMPEPFYMQNLEVAA